MAINWGDRPDWMDEEPKKPDDDPPGFVAKAPEFNPEENWFTKNVAGPLNTVVRVIRESPKIFKKISKEDLLIIELSQEGLTDKEIAQNISQKYGYMTEDAVKKRRQRAGVRKK